MRDSAFIYADKVLKFKKKMSFLTLKTYKSSKKVFSNRFTKEQLMNYKTFRKYKNLL